MGTQEDYSWEEVYRANGCSPLYQDDVLEDAPAHEAEELRDMPLAVIAELEPLEDIPPKVPLLAN